MTRNYYEMLDAIVVVGSLAIVGGGIGALVFFTVPGENLAVVSGLLGTIAGTILGGYAGFRWGASTNRGPQDAKIKNAPKDPVPVEETHP